MKIIWLGHSGFRIEAGGKVLLIDPWLVGNPAFPEARMGEATSGATHIFLTHGHGDHASNAVSIAKAQGIPVAAIHEIAEMLGQDGAETMGFGKGGTLDLGGVTVTMVHAIHSSSFDFKGDMPQYAGDPAGFILRAEGHTIYISGDTDVMADMEIIADRYKPDIGILSAGGRYTMDMEGAAYAVRRFFDFTTVIPCHYKTFPILAQDADALRNGLPVSTRLLEPEVLAAIEV